MAGEPASGGASPLGLRPGVSSASADAALVSESLEGLVSAVDELKRSMGLGEAVDLSEIELFIHRLRTENEEFQHYAEQAILVRLAVAGVRGRLRAVQPVWQRDGAGAMPLCCCTSRRCHCAGCRLPACQLHRPRALLPVGSAVGAAAEGGARRAAGAPGPERA